MRLPRTAEGRTSGIRSARAALERHGFGNPLEGSLNVSEVNFRALFPDRLHYVGLTLSQDLETREPIKVGRRGVPREPCSSFVRHSLKTQLPQLGFTFLLVRKQDPAGLRMGEVAGSTSFVKITDAVPKLRASCANLEGSRIARLSLMEP